MLKFALGLSFLLAIYDKIYTVAHEIAEHDGLSYFAFMHILSISIIIGAIVHLVKDHKRDIQELRERIFHIRRKRNEAVKNSSFLLDNIPNPVALITPDYNLLKMNGAITKLTGVTSDEIQGRKCFEVFGTGEICEGCPVRQALMTKSIQQNVKREITKAGKEIYIEQTAIPIIDNQGHVLQVIEFINDVTERKTLERENRSLFIDTVSSFAGLIDSRDTSTGKHSHRVRDLSLMIGRELGLPDKELEELSITALLHDIGKIGIPEHILNKPERLTSEEYEIIKQHPVTGYNNLVKIKPLESIAANVLYHHEKYDGTGYPNGLRGEQIPLISRIIAVADVYEAVTADRVYRVAMTEQQALDIMHQGRNIHFDPVVLDAFLRTLANSAVTDNLSDAG